MYNFSHTLKTRTKQYANVGNSCVAVNQCVGLKKVALLVIDLLLLFYSRQLIIVLFRFIVVLHVIILLMHCRPWAL